jgi:acetyl-CoA acetyltransferase
MTPWGKWGRNFVEYGVEAAAEALADAGIDWRDVQFVAAGETVRNGYAGYVAGSSIAQVLGWSGAQLNSSYGACASGTMAIDVARARILAGLCDVALVVGADTTPKGFLAPNAGDRPNDPDWLRFRLLGAANPAFFALAARRRVDLYGATPEDFALVKVKNSRHGLGNTRARYRKEVSVDDVLCSPIVSDPLHLLDICATSDGGAAVVLVSEAKARQLGGRAKVRIRGVASVTPSYPNTVLEIPNISTDSSAVVAAPSRSYLDSIAHTAYEQAGIGPEEIDLAEVYDLATSVELDWYEHLGFCAPGEGERLLRDGDTAIGGRIPVNPSGGLACFGEAVPAQAIAQVCEITWQLEGRANGRQVEGARTGVTANKGLFGHGSSVVLSV